MPPEDTTEAKVLRLWCEILGKTDLGDTRSFLTEGGTYESADRMLEEATCRFGTPSLTREYFLRSPTVDRLVSMIDRSDLEGEAPHLLLLQQGSDLSLPEIFCIPPAWDEGGSFRRIANALGPEWTVSMVRPDSSLLTPANPYNLDATANRIVEQIRSARTTGCTFILVGSCLGGLIAYLAAPALRPDGCAGLVLLDTPMPGHPYPYPGLSYPRSVFQYLRARSRAAGAPECQDTMKRVVARKLAWHVLSRSRSLLRPFWRTHLLKRVASQAKCFEVPHFFRIKPMELPTLHFLADAEKDFNLRMSRMAWGHFHRASFTKVGLAGGHGEVFFRPNIPKIADGIRSWVSGL